MLEREVIPVKATATALSSTHTKGSVSFSGHISGVNKTQVWGMLATVLSWRVDRS